MDKIKTGVLAMGLVAVIVLSIMVFRAESVRRALKSDFVELSKVKYGIFSVDEWKNVLAGVVTKKIEEFNMDDTNRDDMREKVQEFLTTTIDKMAAVESEKNKNAGFAGIFSSMGITICLREIRNRIPEITEDVLDFLSDPSNRQDIKSYIVRKLDEYQESTFNEVDYTMHDAVIEKYEAANRPEALATISASLADWNSDNRAMQYALYMVVVAVGAFLMLAGNLTKYDLTLFVVLCLTVLALGLLFPMIDIDARIARMSFTLLGESVVFEDQVLYYKSKSILEVVQLMFTQGKFNLLAVGFLVLLFSVLFPLSKMLCSLALIYWKDLKRAPLINFMVFKTGKWSMADVMVVAIFMAYIGFSGILSEQLKQLQGVAQNVDILTTNESTLQLGFFMFTAFVVLSMFLSHQLGKSVVEE
ncbi:MAG: paraquat-inducible protein A [Bacteroidota bacterium]